MREREERKGEGERERGRERGGERGEERRRGERGRERGGEREERKGEGEREGEMFVHGLGCDAWHLQWTAHCWRRRSNVLVNMMSTPHTVVNSRKTVPVFIPR